MTNLHKIRARIRSVNSTQQITRTMKMIAVSKLRKTQTSLAGVRLFADKSQAVLNALLAGGAERITSCCGATSRGACAPRRAPAP